MICPTSKMKGDMDTQQICQRVIEITDEFFSDESKHNLEGIKKLVDKRRKLIALIDDAKAHRIPSEITARMVGDIHRQDEALQEFIAIMKDDFRRKIDFISRSRNLFKRFIPMSQKQAKFDRKS